VADALYELDGDDLVPHAITAGPWADDAQHGGAVAAILARAVERVPSPVPSQVVRLTVELLRPVPIRPLRAEAATIRPGKKVQLVEVRLVAEDVPVALARALRIRSQHVEVPAQPPDPPSPAPPDSSTVHRSSIRVPFAEAFDLRFAKGSWDAPGPVTIWTRLRSAVVAGEEPTPLQRTSAAADFGNGVSRLLDFATHVFINPDLTVSLSRAPVGDWIGFDVVSRLSSDGYGQAESLIFDPSGPVGRAVQSLIVELR
jgi:hypothetical protein